MKRSRSSILDLVRRNQSPVKFRDMMIAFGVGKSQRKSLLALVEELVDEGELEKTKGNAYRIPDPSSLLTGKLALHRDGYGFVTPDAGGEDIYIPARHMRDAVHGDRVEARVVEQKRGGKREGRIFRIVERTLKKITGIYRAPGGRAFVVPDDRRISFALSISPRRAGGARDGDVVAAEIVSFPTERTQAEGRVVEVLGAPGDPEVEFRKIVYEFALPVEFPPEVLAEARRVARPVEERDIAGRTDLRDLPTVTIDGEKARDFDDAVSIRREKGGGYRLWVSIADVSHYVRPGTALDREAYNRATSVYFPDRAIPMLPEELSNGICSLNPEVDRLAMTAEIVFGRGGNVRETSFYPSVIRSKARLTYTVVAAIIERNDPEAVARHKDLVPHLRLMAELASALTERRRKRGSIDFDLPEPEIVLDLQGKTEAIVRSERNLAHRLIEEFMLSANEAVAHELDRRRIPSLYRIHEPPDPAKLYDFRDFIKSFGYELPLRKEGVSPAELQAFLDHAEGKPEEKMINQLLLRCMKQARYSEENVGHFGLAAGFYTHFTSPIRRYPDLVVHRILRSALDGSITEAHKSVLEAELPETAAHTSRRERIAMEAEREIVELAKARFMSERVGEEFDGFISGVTGFGLFVELTELFVEGLVHVTSLTSDFYRYIEKEHSLVGERTGEVFRIGDTIRVRVAGVNMERRQVEFVPAVLAEPKREGWRERRERGGPQARREQRRGRGGRRR